VGFNREVISIMQIDDGAAHRPTEDGYVRYETAALARVGINNTEPVGRAIPAC
jgi:hypothetical protein